MSVVDTLEHMMAVQTFMHHVFLSPMPGLIRTFQQARHGTKTEQRGGGNGQHTHYHHSLCLWGTNKILKVAQWIDKPPCCAPMGSSSSSGQGLKCDCFEFQLRSNCVGTFLECCPSAVEQGTGPPNGQRICLEQLTSFEVYVFFFFSFWCFSIEVRWLVAVKNFNDFS